MGKAKTTPPAEESVWDEGFKDLDRDFSEDFKLVDSLVNSSAVKGLESLVEEEEFSPGSFDSPPVKKEEVSPSSSLQDKAYSNKKKSLSSKSSLKNLKLFQTSSENTASHRKALLSPPMEQNNPPALPVQMVLKQSESLKVAQSRIHDLESELKNVLMENEEYKSLSEDLKKQVKTLYKQHESLKASHKSLREEFKEDRQNLEQIIQDQMEQMKSQKQQQKDKDLKQVLLKKIQNTGFKEKELQHRLELMSMENQVVSQKKDQYILKLKNQMDDLKLRLEHQKKESAEMEKDLKKTKKQSQKSAHALRVAMRALKPSVDVGEEEVLSHE